MTGSEGGSDGTETTDTETEIAQRRTEKSRKTMKRKRRATSPSRFGAALESLLSTRGPDGVAAPMSLKPGVGRRQKEEKLERGARKVLAGEKKEREEKGRVKDVIGGWGVEGERALRKVAQRGVIKLFNAVQQSQAEAEQTSKGAKAQRGKGKATLPAPDPERNDKKKKTKSGLDEDSFMGMIRAGAVVSKA
ncbi:Rrp15p-domain-containing protein [Gautieria morchelliformis]|nr:Rrp15p-domain-containing protein [Gautieria morchelliformis]